MKHTTLFFFFLLLFCVTVPLVAQEQPFNTPRADTTAVSDTLIKPVIPLLLLGSVNRTLDSQYILLDSAISFSDYQYLGDLLARFPGVYIRDLGSPGQNSGLTINGMDSRSIAIMRDGVLLNDPMSGSFDLNLYPTEDIERIEFIPASRAFLYGLNASGGAINLVSKSYNAIHPVSQIRFVQSTYEYTYFDGMVSQDIKRGLNVTIGFRHPSTTGRFLNSDYQAWGARFKVRYNLSDDINVFVSDVYNQTQTGLNGGVDSVTDPLLRYERNLTTLRNVESYEKITRHDLQAGAGMRLLGDTTAITSLTVFYSNQLREYRDEENRQLQNGDRFGNNGIFIQDDHKTEWEGIRLGHEMDLFAGHLSVGGEFQSRKILESPLTGSKGNRSTRFWGMLNFNVVPLFSPSVFAALENRDSHQDISFGGDASLNLIEGIRLKGGISYSKRYPTLMERYGQDSTFTASLDIDMPEKNVVLEGGVEYKSLHFNGDVTYTHRVVDDAIVALPFSVLNPFPAVTLSRAGKRLVQAFNVHTEVFFKPVYAEGNLMYLKTETDNISESLFPQWSGSGGVYFWDTLFDAHLRIKVGLRGRIVTAHTGVEYNPQLQYYVPSKYYEVKAVGLGDFVLQFHLGDADIHLIMENLFDRNYIIVPYYPMTDRALRFGLNWEFLN